MSVGFSKTLLYERPYNVTGVVVLTGIKEAPKDIGKAKIIGTWTVGTVEDVQILRNVYEEKQKKML